MDTEAYYTGWRDDFGEARVIHVRMIGGTEVKRELLPGRSQAVRNHSPDGFEWGYEGSGPSQLALAILLDCGVPAEEASRLYHDFKRVFVARWGTTWKLEDSAIATWLALLAEGVKA